MGFEIRAASSQADIQAAAELFVEYQEWLGQVVCSVRLAEEIASLPGPYADPEGVLLVAWDDSGDAAVGIVGVRSHHGDACEIKRLYVRPGFRGHGLGRQLAEAALSAGTELGYRRALLTTLPGRMARALAIYRDMGFSETDAFLDHSHVAEDIEMAYLSVDLEPRK